MICPSRTPTHVLEIARRIAAELTAEALNLDADHSMAARVTLAALALAVDIEASRRAGVEPVDGARETLARELVALVRQLIPASLQATG